MTTNPKDPRITQQPSRQTHAKFMKVVERNRKQEGYELDDSVMKAEKKFREMRTISSLGVNRYSLMNEFKHSAQIINQ